MYFFYQSRVFQTQTDKFRGVIEKTKNNHFLLRYLFIVSSINPLSYKFCGVFGTSLIVCPIVKTAYINNNSDER